MSWGSGGGRRAGRSGPVGIEIGDRVTVTDCVVEARGSKLVIGHIVLAVLDLVVDTKTRTLAPRHPEGPVIALRAA